MFDLGRLGAWRALPFFETNLPQIEAQLASETQAVFPPSRQVFAALERVQPDDVRVVILGQDPYPTFGHAHGFAFSADGQTQPLPRSLANIFREMQDDLGAQPPNADLRFWADQGVLLLNTILTVPEGTAKGHAKLGWQNLTAQVLERLSDSPRCYLLWGKDAHKAAADVDPTANFKLHSSHPSPLGVTKSGATFESFRGSRPFSRSNAWLRSRGHQSINWSDPEAL